MVSGASTFITIRAFLINFFYFAFLLKNIFNKLSDEYSIGFDFFFFIKKN